MHKPRFKIDFPYSIFKIFLLAIFTGLTSTYAQELRIRNVDESKFPEIKAIIEFPAGKSIDFTKIKLLETNDTLVFSVDSIPDSEHNKSICILMGQEILNNEDLFDKSLALIKDMASILSTDDRSNIIISNDIKSNATCYTPVSYEFTSDLYGLTEYFKLNQNSFIKPLHHPVNSCSIKKSMNFLAGKKNIPAKKLLCILSDIEENQIDSISDIKRKAREDGISIAWFKISKEKAVKDNPVVDIQAITETFDSIFVDKYSTTYMNKKLYVLKFLTTQNNELNQFEIEYKGLKLRSTFAKPDYMSFFKKNMLLLGIIAFFLLLIIFFIVNLIYTKRQMMLSVRELKLNNSNASPSNDLNLDNYSPNKTQYGTNSVTPFITVEIEGKKINFELHKLVTRIGRSEENDIIIDNLTISNQHASVHIEDGQFFIQDNASTNGTYVNDIKISKILIKNGDVMRIGKARLILTC